MGDALQIEMELGLLKEEVDVLEIGLHVFAQRRLAVHVEVVFHLHLVVDEDFAPAFGEHDFLLYDIGRAVAEEIECLLQIRHHGLDLVVIFDIFILRQFLGLSHKSETEQEQGDYGDFFHG